MCVCVCVVCVCVLCVCVCAFVLGMDQSSVLHTSYDLCEQNNVLQPHCCNLVECLIKLSYWPFLWPQLNEILSIPCKVSAQLMGCVRPLHMCIT